MSQISLMEIAIKQRIGKLPELTIEIEELIEQLIKDNFQILPIKTNTSQLTIKSHFLNTIVTHLTDY